MKNTDFLFETTPGMKSIYADTSNSPYPNLFLEVPYIERDGQTLHFQLLSTAQRGEKRPLLVYVQGSAWMKQNKFQFLPKLIPFAMAGYAVASIEYRPSDVAPFPAQILDVRAAIQYLRDNAAKHSIDPDRIAIFGDSSGGHTSVMCAVAEGKLFEEEGIDAPQFRCVVDFYGPSALDEMPKYPSDMDHADIDSPECRVIGGLLEENSERIRQADPRTYITPERHLPPILIMHGDRDSTVPFNQSLILYEKLRDCGKDAEFYKVHGAGHGNGMWGDRCIGLVLAFLEAYL